MRRHTAYYVTSALSLALIVSSAAKAEDTLTVIGHREVDIRRTTTSDTVSLIEGEPGVALQTGGGISSLPVVHGLASDRVKIVIDGQEITSACANHMNPPLGYVAASAAGTIGVQAGITPVSEGGDSLGGTITVTSAAPLFATTDQGLLTRGEVSGFYRSNGENGGASGRATVASRALSLSLAASSEDASDYEDGKGRTVTSSYYKVRNVSALIGYKAGNHLFTLRAANQSIPGQGFVNQQMDMIKNTATSLNFGYVGTYDWGRLEASVYGQNAHHLMNIGPDKLKTAGTMMMPDMPMNTHGRDYGYKLKATIPLQTQTLKLGHEYHRFDLDDWWPPVAGTMMMAPGTFLNIEDGQRTRISLYGELETRHSAQLTTLIGLRTDEIKTDTHNVVGYNMMYATDATAFNAVPHARSERNWDFTAVARLTPDATSTFEVGYARKSRAPNLYERYTWARDWMSSAMIGWAGDGNAYVGNQNLKSEVAHTFSASAHWHGGAAEAPDWELTLTPYVTAISDYVDVQTIKTRTSGLTTMSLLQFVNQEARLYGLDATFEAGVWDNAAFGRGKVRAVFTYTHGRNEDTGQALYHIMPANLRLSFDQSIGKWRNSLEVVAVAEKSSVSDIRREPQTPAYGLLNLSSTWQGKATRVTFGVTNLLDTAYALPLGGVNVDDYLASNWTGRLSSVRGKGRSVNIAVTQSF